MYLQYIHKHKTKVGIYRKMFIQSHIGNNKLLWMNPGKHKFRK